MGYESLSQFIRDYKKMFHAPPREDIQAIQARLSAGAPPGDAG